jgi:hypothetical protein
MELYMPASLAYWSSAWLIPRWKTVMTFIFVDALLIVLVSKSRFIERIFLMFSKRICKNEFQGSIFLSTTGNMCL